MSSMADFTPSSIPFSRIVDGFQIPGMFSVDAYKSALSYKPRSDDVFLVTYPKCGTTWAQHILLLIFKHGDPMTDHLKFFAAAPFLEMTGAEGAEKMPRPGAIKVHLPYHLTPRSDTAKYIYITRNPFDCCVSYFHHKRNNPGHAFNGTFDQFFELFVSGKVDYGDYFDHLLGWYEHRNDPNVLCMTYEEMKEQPEESVLKMASFIDDKLYAEPLRSDPEKLQNVVKYSSFDYMKEVVNKSFDEMVTMDDKVVQESELPSEMKKLFTAMKSMPMPSGGPPKSQFIRKGIIGDWKNYFSEDQYQRLKKKFDERTENTDIAELWDKYM